MWRPFFSFCAGGHIYELLKRLMKDVIGLRQRLTVVYARPLFMTIADIRQACAELPSEVQHKPALFLACLLFPLLKQSLKKEAEQAKASADVQAEDTPVCISLGTVFSPSVDDGASAIVDAKFDARNQKQKGCYLQPQAHQLSKYHGKLKTKYDRMILSIHYLNALAKHYFEMQRAGIGMWDQRYVSGFELPDKEIPLAVVKFCYLLADHCEMTWAKLDLSRSMHEVDVDDSTMGVGLDQRHTSATQVLPLPDSLAPDTVESLPSGPVSATPRIPKRRRVDEFDPIMKDIKQKLASAGSGLREDNFKTMLGIDAKEWGALFASSVEVPGWAQIQNAVRTILGLPNAWLYYSERDVRTVLKKACPDQPGFCALVAAAVMTLLGLGQLVLSRPTTGGGRRFWYFVKRPLAQDGNGAAAPGSAEGDDRQILCDVLKYFGITESSTPSLTSYAISTTKQASKPVGAPPVTWNRLSADVVRVAASELNPPNGPLLPVYTLPRPSVAQVGTAAAAQADAAYNGGINFNLVFPFPLLLPTSSPISPHTLASRYLAHKNTANNERRRTDAKAEDM